MNESSSSDRPLLDLIRRKGPLTVEEMGAAFEVTPTAIRNRLARLVSLGLVERDAKPAGRGRPKHRYRVSDSAQRQLGQNYADLAFVLWEELLHSVADEKLRRRLFKRITTRLAELYRGQLKHDQFEPRLVELGLVLHNQGVETEVTTSAGGELPVLRQHSCPYYALAEIDRAICGLEREMLEKVLGRGLRLSHCRLDGDRWCDFEPKQQAV